MRRVTARQVADKVGVDVRTVRKLADRGYLQMRRDINGWRIFPSLDKSVKRVKALLEGTESR